MNRSLEKLWLTGAFLLALNMGMAGYAWAQSSPEWIAMGGPQAGREPVISVLASDDKIIEIQMSTPGLFRELVPTPGGEFPRLSMPPEGFTTEIGWPQLPVICRWVEIPAGARVELEVVEEVTSVLSLDELEIHRPIAPVQRPVPKIPGARQAMNFERDEGFYAQDQWYPGDLARLGEIDETRGHRLVLLKVYPVRYNPRKGTVSVCSRLRLKLHLRGSDLEETSRKIKRWHSHDMEKALRRKALNYDRYADKDVPALPIGYLIITHDNFYSQVQPLAQWKEQKGFVVTVTRFSEISPQTSTGIKTYIQDAYDNWPVPPTYVLLVGDVGYIPTFYGSSSSTETDLPYSDMEGSYFPELELGRFSVSSTTEVTAIVDKVLDYERTHLATLNWFTEAVFMASYDNWRVSEGTHNYVISTYLEPNRYTCHKIYARLGGGTSDITSNINAGRAIANYSGHGNRTSWSNPGFSKSNIDNLSNADKYPFVISNACLTSDLGYSECFGEHWVNVANKGGIAHWGSSNYTYWDEDDILEKRMYRAIFEDELFTFAGFTNQAKWYHYQYWDGAGLSRYYYECYILLGDPSLMLPTAIPAALTVDHPATVLLGPSDVTVTVTHEGSPVEDALICAMQEEGIHQAGYTNGSGQAVLSISPVTSDTILVTVTAHNFQPYQGTMVPVSGAPPAAVTDLQVNLAETALMLNWSAVTIDTLSNPKTVSGYVIYRGIDPGFEPSPACSLGTTSEVEYLDATAAVGDTTVQHYYSLVAVAEEGSKSDPSNTVGEFDRWITNIEPAEPPKR